MSDDTTWMGRPIDDMDREELSAALETAVRLLRRAAPRTFIHPQIEGRETPVGTVVARAFNWAFIPAGQLWSERD